MLTGTYWVLHCLHPVLAGDKEDLAEDAEWKKKNAVVDYHFTANNEWVKQQAVKGAAKGVAYVKKTLENLKWMNSTMESDLEAQKLEMPKLLDEKIETSIEETKALGLELRRLDFREGLQQLRILSQRKMPEEDVS